MIKLTKGNKITANAHYQSRNQGGYGGHAGGDVNMNTEYASEQNTMKNVPRQNWQQTKVKTIEGL